MVTKPLNQVEQSKGQTGVLNQGILSDKKKERNIVIFPEHEAKEEITKDQQIKKTQRNIPLDPDRQQSKEKSVKPVLVTKPLNQVEQSKGQTGVLNQVTLPDKKAERSNYLKSEIKKPEEKSDKPVLVTKPLNQVEQPKVQTGVLNQVTLSDKKEERNIVIFPEHEAKEEITKDQQIRKKNIPLDPDIQQLTKPINPAKQFKRKTDILNQVLFSDKKAERSNYLKSEIKQSKEKNVKPVLVTKPINPAEQLKGKNDVLNQVILVDKKKERIISLSTAEEQSKELEFVKQVKPFISNEKNAIFSEHKVKEEITKSQQIRKTQTTTIEQPEEKNDKFVLVTKVLNQVEQSKLQTGVLNQGILFDHKLKERISKGPQINKSEEGIYLDSGIQPKGAGDTARSIYKPVLAAKRTDVVEQITGQIKAFRRSGKNEIEIKLEPEFLGKVKLNLKVDEKKVTVNFKVDNPAVKTQLEHNLPLLKANFLRQGFNVDHIQVETDSPTSDYQQNQYSYQENQEKQEKQQNNQNMSAEEIIRLISQDNDIPALPPEWLINYYLHRQMNILV